MKWEVTVNIQKKLTCIVTGACRRRTCCQAVLTPSVSPHAAVPGNSGALTQSERHNNYNTRGKPMLWQTKTAYVLHPSSH